MIRSSLFDRNLSNSAGYEIRYVEIAFAISLPDRLDIDVIWDVYLAAVVFFAPLAKASSRLAVIDQLL